MNINFSMMELLATAPLETIYLFHLPQEWMEEYEERAAILEYDGGLDRALAERQAYHEISRRMEVLTNNYAA